MEARLTQPDIRIWKAEKQTKIVATGYMIEYAAILDFIFNPSGLPPFMVPQGSSCKDTEANEPSVGAVKDGLLAEYSESQVEQAKKLETDAVVLAEQERYEEALKLFDAALAVTPNNPSIYNNRAQLYRLSGDIDSAMRDLKTAIEMSEKNIHGFKKVASLAYTQLGIIHGQRNEEELARIAFERGGTLGNPIALQESVKLNPYARLCNQMLAEAMKKTSYLDENSEDASS